MTDATRIIDRVQQGDPAAAEELLPLVYEELRKLAAHKMANEPAGHTLQPTALVHEAWIRLVGASDRQWANKGHFFAAAAEAMRRILVDLARRKRQVRHGGGQQRVLMDEVAAAPWPDNRELLVQVHDVLDELAALDNTKAQIVKLRFFVGLSNREIAELLNVSDRTVERGWAFAKAWLFAALKGRVQPRVE